MDLAESGRQRNGEMMKRTALFTATLFAAVLTFGCATEQLTRTGQSRPTTPTSGTAQADTDDPNFIPAGTDFAVRVNEAIESNEPGRTFMAEVAQNIVDRSGRVIVPQGSAAELVIVAVNSGGTVGTRTVSLGVNSITVRGRKYNITTDATQEGGPAGLGTNRRTAEMVGGAAAIGTLIGAIAGGTKGAVVGAAVGAAGGAAAQVLTRGDEVNIPAESVLTFRLDQGWRLS
jgi:hypothetical protein